MGNSLRCCLACVLPCGALDLIRIVHLNGHVEEIGHPITAGEILKANPNHLLTTPSTQGLVRRILILSPESDLKRGCIYFLIPATSIPANNRSRTSTSFKKPNNCAAASDAADGGSIPSDFVSDRKPSRRDRRSVRVVVWRPHLESISED